MVKKREKAFHVKVEVTGALIMPIRSLTIMHNYYLVDYQLQIITIHMIALSSVILYLSGVTY